MATVCRGARILVVEDQNDVRAIALTILVRQGCHVVQACDAASAISVLANDPGIDLVFSDIMLPGRCSGLQLRDDIARLWPRLPVILTSGNVSLASATGDALQRGLSVLPKPYLPRALMERVGAALQGSRPVPPAV